MTPTAGATSAASAAARYGPTALPAVEVVPRRAFVAQIMGLPFSVHVRGPRAAHEAVAEAVESMFDRLRADEREFSPYLPDSAVSRIRRGELRIADASARLRQVAVLCDEAAERTGGAFSAWLPREGATVFDPTGLVKGWATEDAATHLVEALKQLDPRHPYDVLVAAGGDLWMTCRRHDTPDWSVAVEDPHDRSRLVATMTMRTGAVATSGTAARGDHVVDPRTGAPARALASATVVGPSLLWADVYATALLADGGQSDWFTNLPDHAALTVDTQGGITRL